MDDIALLGLVTGGLLILYFIILQNSKAKCNKKIEAIYIRSIKYGHGLSTVYSPVFKYSFDGKEYEQQTFQSFSEKHIKDLTTGKKYDILINEKKPTKFVISKKVKSSEIVLCIYGISGILFIIGGILCALLSK